MMALKIRKLPWAFDETTPVWNRGNPRFGIVANGITFVAPAFERYIVTATRMAMSEISDPEVFRKYEADLREAPRFLGRAIQPRS
jgi:hypothetical protein